MMSASEMWVDTGSSGQAKVEEVQVTGTCLLWATVAV
jgi:hypothetical protein